MNDFLERVKLWECSDDKRRNMLKRSGTDVARVMGKVQDIISRVREEGDFALLEFTQEFDGVQLTPTRLRVKEEEISKAYDSLDEEDVDVIRKSFESVRRYHEEQMPEKWMEEFQEGVKAGQVVRPLESVGCYVPGGTAQYPSSVIMSVTPAKVSGVDRVIVCTPPTPEGDVNPATLVACDIAGADDIYKVGGAQAIAAMAYGTEIISEVQKIVGPGNIYVAAAKKAVSLDVEIDFMAGPSEVLILADSSADPRFVAIDLISQAEHDSASAAVLVTDAPSLADDVERRISEILEDLPRGETARKSLDKYGKIILTRDMEEAVDFANDYSPEHLQIMTEDPEIRLKEVKNASAIFLGSYSPTSVGDFAVGPSHILPTGGEARRNDGLSVYDFIRMPSVQELTREGLRNISDVVTRISMMEGLSAHAYSVNERLEGKDDN
ncbi:MAG: histidinol dehydrogenase [Candidatus Hadarchaeota archaeon]